MRTPTTTLQGPAGSPRRYSHRRAGPKGFTLIELLVVISIIAILISILLPALAKARNLAYQVICSSNLKSLGQGVFEYNGSYNNFPMPAGYNPQSSANNGSDIGGGYVSEDPCPFGNMNSSGTGASEHGGSVFPFGYGLLYTAGIIKNPAVFFCPQASYFTIDGNTQQIGGGGQPSRTFPMTWIAPPNLYDSSKWNQPLSPWQQTLRSPAQFLQAIYLGYNYWFGFSQGVWPGNPGGGVLATTVFTQSVTNPWTGIAASTYLPDPQHPFTSENNIHRAVQSILGSDVTISTAQAPPKCWGFASGTGGSVPLSNHMGQSGARGANILYGDGSVEWKGPSGLHCNYYDGTYFYWE